MNNLFAYGTLMCNDIMHMISHESYPCEKAILKDYQRYLVREETYPALIPEKGGHVEGVVYLGISKSSWNHLDIFEGEIYAKQLVNVIVNNSKMVKSVAYVLKPESSNYITDLIWEYEKFLKNGKERFLNYYNGFKLI